MSRDVHLPEMLWTLGAEQRLPGVAKLAWVMLWARRAAGRPASAAELAADCGVSELAAQGALNALVSQRWVRVEGGSYVPVVPGPYRVVGIPKGTRFAVLRRDHFTCRYCGRSAQAVTLRVDHVIARANGGASTMDNLVTACEDCNVGKGAGPAQEAC
jgi:hypothetical protein